MKYNLELLNSFVKENKVELIGNYENLNRETKISGKCLNSECEYTFCKTFRMLINNGGFYCKKCTNLNMVKKCIKTCLEKYNYKHPMQTEEVKEKIKKTFLINYGGVENSIKREELKEKKKETCLKNHGVEHHMQSLEVKEKIKKTCLEKYNCKNPLQNEEVKEKIKKTCLRNHGVENPSQCEKIKDKKKQTCLKNHGVEHPFQSEEVKEKFKRTCLQKFGYECSLQSEEVKEKSKQTCLRNNGVEYPMQNSEIFEKQQKNSLNIKEYILPSGNKIKVQGYENLALDILIYRENIDENDIIINRLEVPEIWYFDYDDGKYHRYYTDIFIKSLNKCIEVKSEWTFYKNKKINLLKHKSVKYNGYNSEIWIFDNKKELNKVIK